MLKRILLAMIVILLLVPTAASAQQATGKVTGTATYRAERVTLPPTARRDRRVAGRLARSRACHDHRHPDDRPGGQGAALRVRAGV